MVGNKRDAQWQPSPQPQPQPHAPASSSPLSQLILQINSSPTPFSAVHLWYACASRKFLHHPTNDSSRYDLTSSHSPANSSCYLVGQCSGPLSAHTLWQVPCPGLLVPVTFTPSLKGSGWHPCREGPLLSSTCLPCSLPLSSRGSSHALPLRLLTLLRALFPPFQ